MLHSIAQFFNSGGSFMWVILAVLAAAIAVMVERLIFYFIICRKRGRVLVPAITKAINANDNNSAIEIAKMGSSPLNKLLTVAVEGYSESKSLQNIEEEIQESAIQEVPRLSQRLNYLSLFANIATLLGLIGTISGLQASFASLATAEASKKAALLAAGIAEAMNTTAFGLIVAVPCMIMYTFLYNKQLSLSKDLDESIVRTLNAIKKKSA